ncbi:sterol regulatory element binding protein cleavage-activating protein [Culex quinquefasciatus]|uniref:Sterol regulatory element binding protein cleavage-activating protein n=1 Tax=Culex quinquefasciatus TaxID=7176 RepID=B0W593_CULQU|nr:sterol regulatory element binding protein cleavage-activating protein [Culex quinquefasciatus]|eukprot:XP_001843877.1 sterol regulatory element binding protein cleavage-activating protein [Culex quinquefasciatus]
MAKKIPFGIRPPVNGLPAKVEEKVPSTGGRITGQDFARGIRPPVDGLPATVGKKFGKRNPSGGGRITCQCWLKVPSTGERITGQDFARGIRPLVDGLPANVGKKVWQEESVRRWTDYLSMLAKSSVHRRIACQCWGKYFAKGIRPPVNGLPAKVEEKVPSTGGRITGQDFARGIRPPVDGLPATVGKKFGKRNPSGGGRITCQCWLKVPSTGNCDARRRESHSRYSTEPAPFKYDHKGPKYEEFAELYPEHWRGGLKLSHLDEKVPHHFHWKALAAALDPLDLNDADTGNVPYINTVNALFYPETPKEILLCCMLIAVSFFMITYHTEWRASWTANRHLRGGAHPQQRGHQHHQHLTWDKVVTARLSCRIDFLRLETYTQGRQIDWGFTSAYQRTHIRTGSAGCLSMFQQPNGPANVHHASEEELRCILEFHQQGHQMPLDVTSAKDYRKLREYEQAKFLSMVKQVKEAGATLAIWQRGFDDEANHLLLQQELPAVRSGRIVPRLIGLNYTHEVELRSHAILPGAALNGGD